MQKSITLLRMFEVKLSISTNPFILSIHDCENGKTVETQYELTDGSPAQQAVMYLNRKGIMITHMALSTGDSVALLTEDITTDI
jgi:hypothetical protein